jgi:hypothetical protein
MRYLILALVLLPSLALAQAGPVQIIEFGVTNEGICGIANMDDDIAEEIVVSNGADIFVVDSATGQVQFSTENYSWAGVRVPGYNPMDGSLTGYNVGLDCFVDTDGDGKQEIVLLVAQVSQLYWHLAIVDIEGAGVATVSEITPQAWLDQNHPNPFNPTTNISFSLTEAGPASIKVYDVRGREVRSLLDRNMPAGKHTVTWDGTDNNGRTLASGTYFYTMQSEDGTSSRKALLLK